MFNKNRINNNGKTQFTMQRALWSILIITIIGFSFVLWVTFFYPMVENDLRIWEMFVIFYILISALWMTLLIGLFGLGKKALKGGIVLIVISALFDLFYPPYAVGFDGNIPVNDNAGYRGSIDYTFGYYLNMAGLHGVTVFILTYFIIPLVAFVTMLLVLKPKGFMQSIKNTM